MADETNIATPAELVAEFKGSNRVDEESSVSVEIDEELVRMRAKLDGMEQELRDAQDTVARFSDLTQWQNQVIQTNVKDIDIIDSALKNAKGVAGIIVETDADGSLTISGDADSLTDEYPFQIIDGSSSGTIQVRGGRWDNTTDGFTVTTMGISTGGDIDVTDGPITEISETTDDYSVTGTEYIYALLEGTNEGQYTDADTVILKASSTRDLEQSVTYQPGSIKMLGTVTNDEGAITISQEWYGGNIKTVMLQPDSSNAFEDSFSSIGFNDGGATEVSGFKEGSPGFPTDAKEESGVDIGEFLVMARRDITGSAAYVEYMDISAMKVASSYESDSISSGSTDPFPDAVVAQIPHDDLDNAPASLGPGTLIDTLGHDGRYCRSTGYYNNGTNDEGGNYYTQGEFRAQVIGLQSGNAIIANNAWTPSSLTVDVTGEVRISGDTRANLASHGDTDIDAANNINIDAKNNINIDAMNDIHIVSSSSVVDIEANNYLNLYAGVIIILSSPNTIEIDSGLDVYISGSRGMSLIAGSSGIVYDSGGEHYFNTGDILAANNVKVAVAGDYYHNSLQGVTGDGFSGGIKVSDADFTSAIESVSESIYQNLSTGGF